MSSDLKAMPSLTHWRQEDDLSGYFGNEKMPTREINLQWAKNVTPYR
jgi:hypothetical protein